jgi:hypothetical protein
MDGGGREESLAGREAAMKNVRRVLVAIGCAVMLVIPAALYPCGPVFYSPAFVLDDPQDRAKYAAGDLGIPLRSYSNADVFIAYRYLSGQPLTKEEQASVYELPHGINTFAAVYDEGLQNGITKPWIEARNGLGLLVAAPAIQPFKDAGNYEVFLNCPPPAFQNAAATLADRAKRYNAEELKNWVAAQDQVFSNCSGKINNAVPAEASANASALLKQDRAYQIAAANFYAGYFDNAIAGFRAIANDKASPWQPWGEFLVGRALIRKATLNTERSDEPFDMKTLAEAEAVLRKVADDPQLAAVHGPALQMLGFIDVRLHPAETKMRLGTELARPQPGAVMATQLENYVHLLKRRTNQSASDEMTEWIAEFYKFGTLNPEDEPQHPVASGQEAIEKWRQKRTLPWLTLAISAAQPSDNGLKDVEAAAEKVKADSPAYATVRYHLARLALLKGDLPNARIVTENYLNGAEAKEPASVRNMFLSERLQAASNLADFLHYAQRKPLLLSAGDAAFDEPCEENTPGCRRLVLDPYAARAFDGMALSMWIEAANSRELDGDIRKEIAMTAWCRAVLAQDWAAADQAAPIVESVMPASAKYLDPYRKAASPDAKEFAAVYAMLHWPGIQPTLSVTFLRDDPVDKISNFRMNWWCSFEMSMVNAEQSGKNLPEPPTPAFVKGAQKQAAYQQQQKVLGRKLAPNYLVPTVIAWAKAHPEDARNAEALALSVKATRFSCSNDKTSEYSKAAFMLLHEKYPKSEWTKKTKYYY